MERNSLRGPLLRSVSRSFYLSLRFLPKALRDPLSLAYLLARATDTIADTTAAPVALRTEALRHLAGMIQGNASEEGAAKLHESFVPLQRDKAERVLIEQVPALLDWLGELSAEDREEVRSVLLKINRGQTLDLQRFGAGNEIRALKTAAELDEYTYLVAGCVGEFWTRVCFAHVKNFSARAESDMSALGVQYGKGLQLINIMRDAGNDLRNGRCYFPEEELDSLGLEPRDIVADPSKLYPALKKWREKAEKRIEAGIDYAGAIRNRRVRFATALPALIGARTLTLLREAGPEALTRRVKVSRDEVRKLIASSVLASPRSLQRAFEKLR
ncbi:MAG TPA: phytoene/squalene synthase family protein [Chthoniobacterales bacterium]|jgi:farnesyl-diphosphate farnesyltransferase|nr:phytoene/squalene synthase family protein [Chthoniobacterales bacterium]